MRRGPRGAGWDYQHSTSPRNSPLASIGQNSPESLAKYYDLPLWSDKHLELVAKSMALMAEINSRQVHMDLAIDFYGLAGNPESMVRWIKQPDGGYKHDFTVFDKYLDLAAKAIGKPTLLRLNCWGEIDKDNKNTSAKMVSLLDPATGKLEALEQPPLGTEESFRFWKPVLDEARKRIEARGWMDVTAMGHNSYCSGPAPQTVSVFKKIWSDGVWSYTAHNGTLGAKWKGAEPGVEMLVRYADALWTHGTPTARGYRALLKPRPGTCCFTYRGHRDLEELALCRNMAEWEICAGHDGYCDFGVDFFPVKKAAGNGYYILGNGRGTGGPTDGTLAWMAPGPDGPITTERFEMLREGVEISEAILFLEKALQDKKISGDLEQRANRYLDERGEPFVKGGDFWWGWVNTPFEADEKLLTLAGEVAAAQGSR